MVVSTCSSLISNNAASQIIGCLPQKDRNNLKLVNKAWNHLVHNFELNCYKSFKDKTFSLSSEENKNSDEQRRIYYSLLNINDNFFVSSGKILHCLGIGGCKQVFEISDFQALVVPNMTSDNLENIACRWNRIVSEEIQMSKLLESVGLLTPMLRYTRVAYSNPENGPDVGIPAYITDPFSCLKEIDGMFIVDLKNPDSSTWVKGENFLFNSTEERLVESNWDAAFEPFLTDVLKICTFNLPVSGDSVNIAIVKKQNPKNDLKDEFEIRYFGFDFTHKNRELNIAKYTNNSSIRAKLDTEKAKTLIEDFLIDIFLHEFVQEYANPQMDKTPIYKLRDTLNKKFLKCLKDKMETPQYFEIK